VKKLLLVLCIICSLATSSGLVFSWDHPETVRLGGRIIGPGTSKVEVLKHAGKPMMREESGINLSTGDLKEVWYYEYANKTALIHIEGGKVTEVEFSD